MIFKMMKCLTYWIKSFFITQAAIGFITDNLSKSEDLKTAVQQFIDNFQAEYETTIISYQVKDNVAKAEDHSFSGIAGIEFKYKIGRKINSGKAVLKIPSLASMPREKRVLSKFQIMFDREVLFYKTILPELYRLGQCKPFAPKLYAATEANALVLEDLRVDGFTASDQTIGLDLDQCWKSLDVLATYHALGYKYLRSLRKNDPSWLLIELSPLGQPNMNTIYELVKTIKPYLSEQLYQTILQLQNGLQLTDKYSNENRMTVLIHGDFRSSNIFFKYDSNNKICEAKVIDWQMSREDNPVLDLIIFFIYSISIETIEIHDDALLNFYLEKLNKNLASLNTNHSYNKLELDADIIYYKYNYLSLISSFFLPSIKLAVSRGADTDTPKLDAAKWLSYLNKKGII